MTTRRDIWVGAAALAAMPVAACADDAALFVPVPFAVTAAGKAVISVRINGNGPYPFVVDTGASVSAIQADLAEQLGLKFVNGTAISGVGGEQVEAVYLAKAVQFGPYLHQKGVTFGGLTRLKSPFSGLVAAGFLTTRPSVLDYGAKEIRIYTKGMPDLSAFIAVDSYLDAPNPHLSMHIYVHIMIDGIPLKLMVDTGAPSHVVIYPSIVRDRGLWDKYGAGVPGKVEGVTGAITGVREVVMPNFALGDVTVPHLPVTLMDPTAHNENNGIDGLLGSRFLQMFAVAITAKGMALRPIAQSGPAAASSSAS